MCSDFPQNWNLLPINKYHIILLLFFTFSEHAWLVLTQRKYLQNFWEGTPIGHFKDNYHFQCYGYFHFLLMKNQITLAPLKKYSLQNFLMSWLNCFDVIWLGGNSNLACHWEKPLSPFNTVISGRKNTTRGQDKYLPNYGRFYIRR